MTRREWIRRTSLEDTIASFSRIDITVLPSCPCFSCSQLGVQDKVAERGSAGTCVKMDVFPESESPSSSTASDLEVLTPPKSLPTACAGITGVNPPWQARKHSPTYQDGENQDDDNHVDHPHCWRVHADTGRAASGATQIRASAAA